MATAEQLPPLPDDEATLREAFETAINWFFPDGEQQAPLVVDGFAYPTNPLDNVIGVAIGSKVKASVRTKTRCISLYVEHKFPFDAVPSEHLLPQNIKGVLTDIVDAGGPFEPFQETIPQQQRLRPALPGYSIGVELPNDQLGFLMAATLGAVVESNGAQYVLSNNHVLANVDSLPTGTPVFQPGLADGGRKGTDEIAHLSRYIPLNNGQSFSIVDCALAELIGPTLVAKQFPSEIGVLAAKDPIAAQEGMRVAKVGRTTGYTEGVVVETGAACKLKFGNRRRQFRSQIFIQKELRKPKGFLSRLVGGDPKGPFSQKGDSGSLVVDLGTRKGVGLLCGGSPLFTVANELSEVFFSLNVRLVI
jgi:hypothetical protein